MTNRYLKIIAGLVIGSVAGTALATDHGSVDNRGLYLGAGYGLVKAKGADEFDDDNDAGKLFIGGQFHQAFAIEAGYIDFGKFGGNVASADIDGFSLALKAGIPLGHWVTLYGQGGQLWWDADLQALGLSADTDGEELFYGVGASFALSEGWDMRIEYTRFNVEFERNEIGIFAENEDLDTDLDYVSAGIQHTF